METTKHLDKINALMDSKSQNIYREVIYDNEFSGQHSIFIIIPDNDLTEIKRIKTEVSEDCEFEIIEKFPYLDTQIEKSFLSDIDTETPYYPCTFTAADFPNGVNEKADISECRVILNRQQYINLLKWRTLAPKIGFDSLIFADRQLYYDIRLALSEHIFYGSEIPAMITPSFAIEDTQIQAEINEILKDCD